MESSNRENQKILLIGGEGVIGSELIQSSSKNSPYISLDLNKRRVNRDQSEHIYLDIRDEKVCKEIIQELRPDGIIHLAAVSRVVDAQNDKENCIDTNINGTKNIITSIRLLKKKPWVIFSSSREVYGEAGINVSEDVEKKPINIYGHSKLAGERLWTKSSMENNHNVFIMRFSNVYGSVYDIPGRVVPKFVNSIIAKKPVTIEGGKQLIDFTYIEDVVNVLKKIQSLLSKSKENRSINCVHISPGSPENLFSLIKYIEIETKNKATIEFKNRRNYDVIEFGADNSKVKKILPNSTFVKLEKGIPLYYKKVISLKMNKITKRTLS